MHFRLVVIVRASYAAGAKCEFESYDPRLGGRTFEC